MTLTMVGISIQDYIYSDYIHWTLIVHLKETLIFNNDKNKLFIFCDFTFLFANIIF